LSLRYLYLTAHYRDPLNFTWKSLSSAQSALNKLRSQVLSAKDQKSRTTLSPEKQAKLDDFKKKFVAAINDDLNTPQALAVLWEMMKSNIPSGDKYDLALSFDEVLGLNLSEIVEEKLSVPDNIKKLVNEREALRKGGEFEEADKIRKEVLKKGYAIEDLPGGPKIKRV
jgi:cysteinyl-tRNA synthetase